MTPSLKVLCVLAPLIGLGCTGMLDDRSNRRPARRHDAAWRSERRGPVGVHARRAQLQRSGGPAGRRGAVRQQQRARAGAHAAADPAGVREHPARPAGRHRRGDLGPAGRRRRRVGPGRLRAGRGHHRRRRRPQPDDRGHRRSPMPSRRRLASLLPCTPLPTAAGEQEACAKKFINDFGKRAYRRPLSAARGRAGPEPVHRPARPRGRRLVRGRHGGGDRRVHPGAAVPVPLGAGPQRPAQGRQPGPLQLVRDGLAGCRTCCGPPCPTTSCSPRPTPGRCRPPSRSPPRPRACWPTTGPSEGLADFHLQWLEIGDADPDGQGRGAEELLAGRGPVDAERDPRLRRQRLPGRQDRAARWRRC